MTRMSNDAFPQNRSTFDGLVRASIIVGAIVAAVLITMTIAGANVVRPIQVDGRWHRAARAARARAPSGAERTLWRATKSSTEGWRRRAFRHKDRHGI